MMIEQFLFYFLLFFCYCVIGYLVEILFCTIYEKKLILNRGFLIGPYLPIYGVGAFLSIFFLTRYQDDLIVLFVMSAVICSLVEYLTSLILEKIFKIRWWDYSNHKFNLEGRICLFNSVLFGFGGIIIVKMINPILVNILNKLSNSGLYFIGVLCLAVFTIDFVITIITMVKLKLNSSMFVKKDATEEVKQKIYDTLGKRTFLISRVLQAFPKIDLINDDKIKEFNEFIENLKQEKKKKKRDFRK